MKAIAVRGESIDMTAEPRAAAQHAADHRGGPRRHEPARHYRMDTPLMGSGLHEGQKFRTVLRTAFRRAIFGIYSCRRADHPPASVAARLELWLGSSGEGSSPRLVMRSV